MCPPFDTLVQLAVRSFSVSIGVFISYASLKLFSTPRHSRGFSLTKKPEVFCKASGRQITKTAGKFSLTCLPLQQLFRCTGVQILSQSKNGGFISSNMHPEIPAFGQQKTPTESGFCGTYLFYVPFMVEHRGLEPLTPTLPV